MKKKLNLSLDKKILFKSYKYKNKIGLLKIIIINILFYWYQKFIPNYIFLNSQHQIIKPYIISQKDFCENFNKYINKKYEKELILIDAKINELYFHLYIYKSIGFLKNAFKKEKAYEITISNNIIEALKFYSLKKKIINNKDIFIIDIGTNIGWYPSLLGRYGYTILCFEAFEKNYYVAKKNYCYLNKESNEIIITKGLGSREKKCNYFTHINNTGNGMVLCDNNGIYKNKTISRIFKKDSEVEITTLNTFMPYLSNKNIALMKIDIEGNEFKALVGGKELITKHHVPFVVLEFTPWLLKEIGSEPRELLQLFVDNGYKISIKDFLSKEFINIDDFLRREDNQINLYFIHESMIL